MKNFIQFLISLLVICFLSVNVSYGQVAGQLPLNPKSVPQFVDPLPHFAGLRVNAKAASDLFVKAVPHSQVAVSTGTILGNGSIAGVTPGAGLANLWVYQLSTDGNNFTPPLWPAFTVETERGNPLNVYYSNNLNGETYEKIGIVVDQTLHWANPNGLAMNDPARFLPFFDAPPITVHLHGGEVSPLSDGGPDSWFTPGNALTGHAYNPGPYVYPNKQEAATLWFHDHALGVTRLNVYAGMAGFYFLRGGADEDALKLPGWSGDDMVKEVPPAGASGVFNPNPYLPEIEIVIQDRMFDTNGKLYFPNLPTNPGIHPFWTPEFVGDIITVNGKTWPYLSVAPRKYRFRILNGSNARTYELWLQDLASGVFGPAINQIGTDGGFLETPVLIDPAAGGKLVLMPGERVDVIIDFSASATGTIWTMKNSGKTPYPAGAPVSGSTLGRIMQFVVNGTMIPGPNNTTKTAKDLSMLPANLKTNIALTNFTGAVAPGVNVSRIRQLTLNEVMAPGGPLEALVNNTKWSGESLDKNKFPNGIRPDFVAVSNGDIHETFTYYSEMLEEGTTEIWQIINLTGDAHPIHLHLVQCQLMSRQNYNVSKYIKAYNALFPGGIYIGGYGPPMDYNLNQAAAGTPIIGGNPNITPYLQGPVKPAQPNERGWKDTYIMYPGEVTTIIVRLAPTDLPVGTPAADLHFPFDPGEGYGYVWHCHIIDHEDNEMMRPYQVIANPANPNVQTINIASAKKSAYVEGNYMNNSGSMDAADILSEQINEISMEQNMPNPFVGETRIRFALPESAQVKLTLINSLGQVTTLIDDVAPSGVNTAVVNSRDLKAGIYFYQLRSGKVTITKRMVVMK